MMRPHEHVTAFIKSCYNGSFDMNAVFLLVVGIVKPPKRKKEAVNSIFFEEMICIE